jgi:3-hydroxyacyl-CoA dehydrogenase/enoyl-CoA hydratase/3-hydroxybutyryl-CoA epimerase
MSDTSSNILWEQGDDGVVILTLDAQGQSANTMNQAYVDSMEATLDRLDEQRDVIRGVVITSAKKTFFAGGDLNLLRAVRPEDSADFVAGMTHMKAQLRRLETMPFPVVSAINGAALGGGLELTLATHHRIAVDNPRIKLGLPEVSLGLLPGAGGVTRTVRMLGIADALMKVLIKGTQMAPAKALKVGLIDELVDSAEDLIPAAKTWIEGNPEAKQPWDQPGFRIPGGTPSSKGMDQLLPAIPANVRKQLGGANYPAPRAIIAAAVEGAQVDLDTALAIEGRYLTSLATGQVAKNMIQAFFFDLQEVNGLRGRDADAQPSKVNKVVVLGAGMMGAAIAYVCAKSGIEVVLKDVSLENAERGKGYSKAIVDKAIERGRSSQEDGDALLNRITPAADASAADGADLVIEAVFEDPGVKAKVFAEIEPHLAPDALLGSNTSTLPITLLSENVSRPSDFIGLHFFSPVDKMPLLEIIKGERTSDEALSRALDLAKQIKKTPIVVNDSRGFFTSRVIGTFIQEGVAMLLEGVPARSIESASTQAGYPAPVLQLTDELSLTLWQKIRNASRAAVESEGGTWEAHPAETVIDRMADEFGRGGRLAGAGFYDYVDGKRTGLWSGLPEAFGDRTVGAATSYARADAANAVPFEDLKERLMFIETLETVKCLDEGVLESAADANIGSIFGIGFPAWTGGVLQYANGYEGGLAGFVARARELEATYGPRFAPPASLVAKAEAGELYGDVPVLSAA